jgi:hypothetical protein
VNATVGKNSKKREKKKKFSAAQKPNLVAGVVFASYIFERESKEEDI